MASHVHRERTAPPLKHARDPSENTHVTKHPDKHRANSEKVHLPRPPSLWISAVTLTNGAKRKPIFSMNTHRCQSLSPTLNSSQPNGRASDAIPTPGFDHRHQHSQTPGIDHLHKHRSSLRFDHPHGRRRHAGLEHPHQHPQYQGQSILTNIASTTG